MMALFSVVVHAMACTTLFALVTHHMMEHTFVKSATQVSPTPLFSPVRPITFSLRLRILNFVVGHLTTLLNDIFVLAIPFYAFLLTSCSVLLPVLM